MITSFYLGTGGFDVGGFVSFFGILSGRSWEKSFHRHSSKRHDIVIYVDATIMQEAMVKEIKATIREQLDGKYTEAEIDKAIQFFK